jgi:hypothetical protein
LGYRAWHSGQNRREYSKALEVAESGADGNRICDVCSRIYQEEEVSLREMAKELASRTTLTEWILHHGSICLNHASKLRPFLPVRLQTVLDRIVQRHIAEMKQEMGLYRQHVEKGTNAGWGALGKVAELLVSQRGITR